MASSQSTLVDPERAASDRKLNAAIEDLSHWLTAGVARKAVVTQTNAYRCRCVYQVLWDGKSFQYANRVDRKAVPIDACFLANARINRAMELICDHFNREETKEHAALLQGLDAISFSASWDDSLSTSDCLVTFHYSSPISDLSAWKSAANQLRNQVKAKQVTGRSRKRIVRAVDDDDEACTIRDTLHIISQGTSSTKYQVRVGDIELRTCGKSQHCPFRKEIMVHYKKPEDAFSHPNASVMCQALAWILSHISVICSTCSEQYFRIAELYCGFGAHTLAIQLLGIPNLVKITAVELDHRLLDALRRNIELNSADDDDSNATIIDIVQGDAGKWAKRQLQIMDHDPEPFNILLVDPPRQGLDVNVIQMLVEKKSIKHFLYVSCGTQAVVRDLGMIGAEFEVRDCLVFDLFPRTCAVETLLYLSRKDL